VKRQARRRRQAAGCCPDIGDRCGVSALPRVGQAIHVLDRPQHVEVIDGFAILARLDHLAHQQGHNLVVAIAIVLIPGQDEEAVIRLGPLNIGIHVVLQPLIALLNGAAVHVMVEVRHNDGHGRQLAEVRREIAGKGHVV